jgi:membrane-associated protein
LAGGTRVAVPDDAARSGRAASSTRVGTPATPSAVDTLREFFHRLFGGDLKALVDWGGYPVLMAIIFAETGLLIGFFLPGDSLLVTTGVLVNAGQINPFEISPFQNLLLLNVVLVVMAVVGDAVGFSIGYRAGPAIFKREKSLLFRKDHLVATQEFYEKHGGKTIILARFMPFARTFAPVVAGVGKMPYRRFFMFNLVGGFSWVVSMTFIGYFLGKVADAKSIEKVVYVILFVSVAPVVFGAVRHRITMRKKAKAEAAAAAVRSGAIEKPSVVTPDV